MNGAAAKGERVTKPIRIFGCGLLLSVVALASGCIVAPGRYHDGYWDHDHDRYWYHNDWHPCTEHREYCR
jgi:hypothetical protein